MAVLLWFVVIYCDFKPWFSGFPSLRLPKNTSKYLILGHFKDLSVAMDKDCFFFALDLAKPHASICCNQISRQFSLSFPKSINNVDAPGSHAKHAKHAKLDSQKRHDQPSKSGSHCWVSDTWKAQRPKLKKPAEKMWDDQAPNLHSCYMAKLHISHSFTEFHRVSQASSRSFERKPGFLIPWPCLIGMLEVGGRFRHRRQFNFIFPSP